MQTTVGLTPGALWSYQIEGSCIKSEGLSVALMAISLGKLLQHSQESLANTTHICAKPDVLQSRHANRRPPSMPLME